MIKDIIIAIKELIIRAASCSLALEHYLLLSSLLFAMGIYGIFSNRRNLITILMSIELMLLAVNINFVAFSVFLKSYTGQIFSIMILTVAAAEAAIGLAILVVYYGHNRSIEVETVSRMRS